MAVTLTAADTIPDDLSQVLAMINSPDSAPTSR